MAGNKLFIGAILLQIVGICWGGYQQTKMTGLHVVGSKIINVDNKTVQLRGVNRPGTEYSCVQYGKIFDGPSDQASIDSMAAWKINAIRVPINEDCWLGTGGVDPSLSGPIYQTAITNYVNALTKSNLAVIVDLHWSSSDPGSNASHKQTPMPNKAQSPLLWTDVANTFKSNLGVLFDIFNEPFPYDNVWDSEPAWDCWRNGDECNDMGYEPAGMQSLIFAIRNTSARNIIMVGGIQYATSLTQWINYKPYDSTGNLAAAVHVYDFNFCRSRGCWNVFWTPVMNNVPLIAGEFGQTDCDTDFITDFMNYADAKGVHYLAWAWLPSDCAAGPSLITNFSGLGTNYGNGVRKHLNLLSSGKVDRFSQTIVVFEDKRSYEVDNWSTPQSKLWFNETSVVHSGNYSIGFTPTVGCDLFYQCWSCINTTMHKGIGFYINGGSTGGQDIQFVLMKIQNLSAIGTPDTVSYEAAVISVSNLTTSGIVANKWTYAYLNLSTVPGIYDGIRFRSTRNETTIYLDDIIVYENHAATIYPSVMFVVIFLLALFL